jgi:hypothetical protein
MFRLEDSSIYEQGFRTQPAHKSETTSISMDLSCHLGKYGFVIILSYN